MTLPFIKMHGLGNDFVIIDARTTAVQLTAPQLQAIANRRTGVGCDQIILLEKARTSGADIFMRIFNPDASEVGACGNASRCVAHLLMQEQRTRACSIQTSAALLDCSYADDPTLPGTLVTVDMGQARLDWREIPLRDACDTLHLPLQRGDYRDPVAVSMGNPHAIFFVTAVAAVPLAEIGHGLEHDPLFPQRANIGFAQILSNQHLRLRTWERGTGLTEACGTNACAAVVAAFRRQLTQRRVRVDNPGGALLVEYLPDGHVLMTGAVASSFRGQLDSSLIGLASL